MNYKINVLSLFDGMSCGQIALERAEINVNKYFASEIDKPAIKITQKNYPNTIQLGDIRSIETNILPRIDLLIGGSPCTGFSLMGNQLNFDDPNSKLFFEYIRILRESKPRYFIFENTPMKEEFKNLISKYLRVQPIEIDSAVFSAQSRKRLYWTNIPNITKPEFKWILIRDIVDDPSVIDDKLYIKNRNISGKTSLKKMKASIRTLDQKFKCLTASGQHITNSGATNIKDINGDLRMPTPEECERAQTVQTGYTSGVSNSQRYKMLGNAWTVDVIVHILRPLKRILRREDRKNKKFWKDAMEEKN